MFPPNALKVLDIFVPEMDGAIPDEVHPSDHVPVRVKFQVKADHKKNRECASAWLECVVGKARITPLTDREIRAAFSFFDREGREKITRHTLEESCLELGATINSELQELLLTCFSGQTIDFSNFVRAYELRLDASRMRGIADLEHAFHFFDTRGSGQLTIDDLLQAFVEIVPIEFSDAEIVHLFELMETDKDGTIDIHMFCSQMCACGFREAPGSQPKRRMKKNKLGRASQILD